jgi:hypothetical protein
MAKAHPETLEDNNFQQTMKNYRKAVNQAKKDTNKIYSIFEPHIACIAKGKTHVKYEFGSLYEISYNDPYAKLYFIRNNYFIEPFA